MILKGSLLPDTVVNEYGEDAAIDTVSTDPWAKFADVLGQGLSIYNQQQLIDANLELAKQGKAPITSSQIAPTVNVGISPDLKNIIMLGGILLLGFIFLSRKKS